MYLPTSAWQGGKTTNNNNNNTNNNNNNNTNNTNNNNNNNTAFIFPMVALWWHNSDTFTAIRSKKLRICH